MAICDPGNRVDDTGLAFKGSMLQLQLYVNQQPETFTSSAKTALGIEGEIDWVSPRSEARYAEYRDSDFLLALGFEDESRLLNGFWPIRGPCWDGLGLSVSPDGQHSPILIEAKSYPGEAATSMSAKAPTSLRLIHKALSDTASWLGLSATPDSWVRGRYQTANRLAHLFFLRETCGLDAKLVFLLVVDDPTHIPTSESAWRDSWEAHWRTMGLDAEPPHTAAVLLPGLARPTQD